MDWLREINTYPVNEVVCTRGKDPSPEKIQGYCMITERGTGCPNLIHKSFLNFKQVEEFGRHSWKLGTRR
jgi:hypothetical protein